MRRPPTSKDLSSPAKETFNQSSEPTRRVLKVSHACVPVADERTDPIVLAALTYSQPSVITGTLPWTPVIPRSSNCVTYQSSDLYGPVSSLPHFATRRIAIDSRSNSTGSHRQWCSWICASHRLGRTNVRRNRRRLRTDLGRSRRRDVYASQQRSLERRQLQWSDRRDARRWSTRILAGF